MKHKKIVLLLALLVIFLSGCGLQKAKNKVIETNYPNIVVYGDSRNGHDEHQKVVDGIISFKPEAVYHTGDLVGDGENANDWLIFNQITDKMVNSTEFYPALGNHEKESNLFFENFDLPNNERWYSTDTAGVHFIVLDTTKGIDENSEQYQWLKNDLEGTDKNDFVAAVFHHPAYSTGKHAEDEKKLKDKIIPLLENYDVDIVFTGHDHAYERARVNNTYHIVTGGGGAPLYAQARLRDWSQVFEPVNHFCVLTIKKDVIEVKVYDTDLRVVDSFSVTR